MTLILSGTDGLSDVDGSAATPAIRGTDTNTGIFFPAADTIGFSEGGVESARFDSSGNLLVGTTTNTNSSKVVAAGVIESTSGGVRFPDGTTQTTAVTSSLKAVRIRTITASATYTVPSGVTALAFFVSGATGGQASASVGKGGVGGAGYSEKYISSPSASYVITIGAAGSTAGGAGGTTTVDTISITGSGGVTNATGSSGGVASGGTFNANGGTGGTGAGGASSSNAGGGGGAGGSRAGNGFNGGNAGTTVGGGGGGGGTGGAGGNGVNGTGGAGGAAGAAATTTSASAITQNPYWVPASGAADFTAGVAGAAGEPTTPYGGSGGRGATNVTASSSVVVAGLYNMPLLCGFGGYGGDPVQFGATRAGTSGAVQIWEFY
jgi:hypothetical protein